MFEVVEWNGGEEEEGKEGIGPARVRTSSCFFLLGTKSVILFFVNFLWGGVQ